jgi:Na+-translocating ferredoxin:NAD+ oxidoreductase RnfC subunit
MDIKELSAILKNNGIVGAGGAGFPTYAKLDNRADTIILNCAECEPLLKLHRQLLRDKAYEILTALNLIAETLGAKEIIIGVKEIYKETIEAVNEYINSFKNMKISLLADVYPMGDEVVLVYETTKKVVRPGGLPIELGIIVINVETCYNVYKAVYENISVTDKLISIVGEVKNPITVRLPLGTTVKDAIRLAGGVTIDNAAYFLGGLMTGKAGNENSIITKTSNAIIVLPDNHYVFEKNKNFNSSIEIKRAAASCCQCQMCTDLCPRNLLGHPIKPNAFMQATTCKDMQEKNIFLDTFFCCSCGLCELYSCFQGLSPRSLITQYKAGLSASGIRPSKNAVFKDVSNARELRKVPDDRLKSRLNIVKYENPAPLNNEVADIKRVKIMLSQHIGAPAIANVKKGDIVEKGFLIASAGNGLSVNIHSSINGKVIEVNDKYIIIESK